MNWNRWTEYFFSLLGFMVGYGNVWRFPYLCYKSGGGAFLLPYLIWMVFLATPLVFLEVSYPQFTNLGPAKLWNLCPLFKGIGYTWFIFAVGGCTYYNILICWTLYYLYSSFSAVLPWTTCTNPWNTPSCIARTLIAANTSMFNMSLTNDSLTSMSTHLSSPDINSSSHNIQNISSFTKPNTASEEFWSYHVLHISDGIQHPGEIKLHLLVALIIGWVIVFFCLVRGIRSVGKVVYFSATVPYALLLALLIRGMMLPGAVEGIKAFIIPRWEKLLTLQVWIDAATQALWSCGIGSANIITIARYNRFHNNCYRDAILVAALDCFTSVFAGFVVFAVIGYMAKYIGAPIDAVVDQGPGIAFIVYPEALSTMAFGQIWSAIFFIMLFLAGLDSQFVMVEVVIDFLCDTLPDCLSRRRLLVTASSCLVMSLLGLPYITQSGAYVLTLVDWYYAAYILPAIAFMEVFVISWIYGVDRLLSDIHLMLGFRPSLVVKISWKFIAPSIILSLWLLSFIKYDAVRYAGRFYPVWAEVIGWWIMVIVLLPIPGGVIIKLLSEKGSLAKRFKTAIIPSALWVPAIYKEEEERRRGVHDGVHEQVSRLNEEYISMIDRHRT